MEALQKESQHLPWLNMMVEWWPEPVIVPFSETYVNQVLSWVKVRTPFRHHPGRSGIVPQEAVIEANPDFYAISWCGTPYDEYHLDSVLQRFAAQPVHFIQQPDRIFKLWEGVIGHPSLRLLDGARQVLEHRLRFLDAQPLQSLHA